jgi:hypothetical protein
VAADPTTPKPRGRPRVEDPMTRLSTRLPSAEYDRLIRAANQQDTSVASLVRQLLILRLPKVVR